MKSKLLKILPFFFLKFYLDTKFFLNGLKKKKYIDKKKYNDFKINNSNFFFGYHDKICLNKDKLLSHKNKKDLFYVGFFDKKKIYYEIQKTNLCSWQLGSQLQWAGKDKVIFNSEIKAKPVSVLYDLKSNKILKSFKQLVYNIDAIGKNFISLNFEDLYQNRTGYGYNLKRYKNFKFDSDLKIINLKKKKILHSIKKLDLVKKFKNFISKDSHFNHATFSPTGKSILFYLVDTIKHERKILLFHYSLNSKKISLINNNDNISHYCWINDKKILFTTYNKNSFSKYKILNLNTKKIKHVKLGINLDGHPMINPKNKNLFVTDTYPDEYGYQKLIVYDLKKKKIVWETFLKFSTSFLSGSRCDLHPKWDYTGKKIVIDYAIKNQRFIRVYDFLI